MAYLDEYPFNILDIANLLRLTIRRELSDSVYVDCPFCQKRKGKLNLNLEKNVWRCNRCGKSGYMFELYAELRGVTVSEAKLELADLLGEWNAPVEQKAIISTGVPETGQKKGAIEQSARAAPEEIDRTMRAMLNMLPLMSEHRNHLHSARGLTDEQIQRLGLRSTPSYKLRHVIPRKLMERGCTVAGVPGFFVDKYGKWTVNFTSWTSGILIPVRSVEGLVSGAQIRLDKPIKDDPDDPDDEGTKYIWFSTSGKHLGTSSGSPINLIGDSYARTVYVTEGALKAGITHCLTGRTVLSIQGANNHNGLKEAFQYLHENGTQLIVEALDTDKFNNIEVAKGAQKIYLLARQCGMRCQSLTWNPSYKGIDDWQIALMRKAQKGATAMNFKDQFLTGRCGISHIRDCIRLWEEDNRCGISQAEFLGLDAQEFAAYQRGEKELEGLLMSQRKLQQFCIYQLDLSAGQVLPFAFKGLDALRTAGYQQPPAPAYRAVCDAELIIPAGQGPNQTLRQIAEKYSDTLPQEYEGRSVAPSDVIELYDENCRQYFYYDRAGVFPSVRFSPALVKNRTEIK